MLLLAALASALATRAAAQAGAPGTITGSVRGLGGSGIPAVVYVVAPRLAQGAGDTLLVEQRRLTFVPAVMLVAPGTTVAFINSDSVLHNVFSPSAETGRFDLRRYSPGESRAHTFARRGVAVILCRLHPEMVAYVLVADAAAWTLTDRDGRFRLEGVPEGATDLVVWHRRAGTRRVSLAGRSPGPLVVTLPGP